ncbi:adhesin [Buttiauxella sp. A111]|uniref:adhesin n=1 Tax=Buttiauxella sp. A111 TaxID=2563088 RepID=UPI0010E03EEE|nr:adhesin [Buttiauxella sp. A111]GDX07335.1 hypothetical protein BSPA111_35500 [Buttiauxella sp. A111]
MLKSIALLLGLMMSGIISCVAADPVNIPSENLVINNFDVDKIDGLSPVCTLILAENKKKYFYNYTEGDICPVGGECTYSAVMILNGKIKILKQTLSDKDTSVFKNDDMTIITTYDFSEGGKDHEDGGVNAVIVIKTKSGEKKVSMSGYCGD